MSTVDFDRLNGRNSYLCKLSLVCFSRVVSVPFFFFFNFVVLSFLMVSPRAPDTTDRPEDYVRRADRQVGMEGVREHASQKRLSTLRQPPLHPTLCHIGGQADGDHLTLYPLQGERLLVLFGFA